MKKSNHQVEIIGAGWGRTGTSSLKAALEILGYPTYHMVENFKNKQAKFWTRAAKGEKVDFNECFDLPDVKYTATTDFPSAHFWREQLRQYPDAKVILTVRNADSWYNSCCKTIFNAMPHWPHNTLGMRIGMMLGLPTPNFREMVNLVVHEQALGGSVDEEEIKKRYNAHNEAVIRECPPEKLLVFEAKQGWEPLCKFLGKPIPDQPFPNLNNAEEFQVHLRLLEGAGYTALALAVLLPVAVAYAVQWRRSI